MGFLAKQLEFEYLTCRVAFLQGLFNWLTAVALETIIPKEGEDNVSQKMNQFIGTSLAGVLFLIVSFYNDHTTFYSSYTDMLSRYMVVAFKRFFWRWPPRPLSLVSGGFFVASWGFGWRVFFDPPSNVAVGEKQE